MKTRVISAAVALAVFIPIVFIGGIWIDLLAALLAAIGVFELFKMSRLDIKGVEGVLAILGSIFLVFPFQDYFDFLPKDANWILFFVIVMAFLGLMVFSKNEYTFEYAAFPILCSLYVGVGFHYFAVARDVNVNRLLFALFIVWATDIGAYMLGRQFGHRFFERKLAPEISPNKTIEGSIGGVICAVVVAYLYFFLVPEVLPTQNALYIILSTIVFSIVGQFGDLVESAIKRFYDVKDSGKLMPGHGGVLDRFDSLLFVFPIMHLLGVF